jgi:hypothetical protein
VDEGTTWQQWMFSRLRAKLPEEWVQIGPLFDEVRTQIPPHTALRWATSRNPDSDMQVDKAQWLYFCQTLRGFGIEHEGSSGGRHGRRGAWAYRDNVRLAHLPGIVCGKCGGPMVRERGEQHKARTRKVLCLYCTNHKPEPQKKRAVAAQPLMRLQTSLIADDGTPLEVVRLTAAPPEIPAGTITLDNLPPQQPEQAPATSEVPRRVVAHWIKKILPFGGGVSLNQIERDLRLNRDNVALVMKKYGISEHRQLVALINRNNLKELILRNGARGTAG